MSNVMSMKSIRNKPHRDGFDLSRKLAFSAKLGELLPVFVEDVMPGDKFKINADWFTRTQPVTSPAYTRFGEYYDFFFVPYHLLWRYFPQFVIQTNDDNWATGIQSNSNRFTQHPYISSKEMLNTIYNANYYKDSGSSTSITSVNFKDVNNFAFSYGALKLLEYLGYGKTLQGNFTSNQASQYVTAPYASVVSSANVGDVALNPFPLAAYQKVYHDFFRNSQWESPAPYSYNFDYLNGSSMKVPLPQSISGASNFYRNGLLTLRYTNYNKDYFLGRLPEKQYGSEAIATPIRYFGSNQAVDNSLNTFSLRFDNSAGSSITGSVLGTIPGNQQMSDVQNVTMSGQHNTSFYVNLTANQISNMLSKAGVGALALRQAEFLQKWKEITQSGGTDYVSQIQKHFGVTPNNEMAHRSTYIGGFDNKFGIDEVVNTNLASSQDEASIAGKGVNAGHGSLNFDVREHGIIIGLYHMSLLPEYVSQMTDKLMTKTMATDYVIPELDNVGMQSVMAREFAGYLMPFSSSQQSIMSSVLGYVPRYAEYKTRVDKVSGVFSSSLTNWVTPLNKITAKSIQSGDTSFVSDSFFYKVNPRILDNVLSVAVDSTVDTDQFLINCGFDVKAVRNISRDGLPY